MSITFLSQKPPKLHDNIERLLGGSFLCVPSLVQKVVPEDQKLARAVLWIASRLQVGWFLGHADRRGWIELHSESIRWMAGSRNAKKAIDLLVSSGIIEVNNSYEVGVRCKRYRLKTRGGVVWVRIDSKVLARKMEKIRMMKRPADELGDWLSGLIETRTTMIFELAWQGFGYHKRFLTPDEQAYWTWAISAMERKDFHFVLDNRFYSNITNLPKPLRSLLRLDGEELVEIDVKCCQPLLLSALYQSGCEEKMRYISDTQDKDFYKHIHSLSGDAKMTRDRIKVNVYRDIMYGEVRDTPMWRVFKREYPILSRLVEEVKTPEYNRLAIEMQKLESDAMIQGVARSCMNAGIPIITIHDAVLCKHKDVAACKSMIANHFKRLVGVEPVVTVKAA